MVAKGVDHGGFLEGWSIENGVFIVNARWLSY